MNKLINLLFISSFIIAISCKTEDAESLLNAEQNAAVKDQSVTEAYLTEAGDMATKAFNEPSSDQIAGGRTRGTITVNVQGDTRLSGATVTLVTDANSTPITPKGIITIDFGAGQTDSKGNVRQGKILLAYEGLRFIPGSKTTTTFEGYVVNSVQIEGTRTVTTNTLTGAPTFTVTFTVTDEDGKATFPDQTVITRNATHTHKIDFGSTVGGSTWTIQGQANGKTRTGSDYIFLINRDLIFKTECAFAGFALPSEGAAVFTVNSLPILLNYGNEGAGCDNKVTVSINGFSQELDVND